MTRSHTPAPTTSQSSQPVTANAASGFLPAVPLLALDRQYAVLREEIRGALDRVCDSGKFVLGPDVHDLEAELARSLRVPHVISCASGSDALLLALMALDINPGDEVILPSYTFSHSVALTFANANHFCYAISLVVAHALTHRLTERLLLAVALGEPVDHQRALLGAL
jgi:hypothetical protein